jgi:two-component system sensor kinase FixL
VNEHQRIIMFNKAAEKMFGLPAGKALGLRLGRLIPKRFRHAHAQHVHGFERTGVTARQMGQLGEIHGLRANGEKFPVEASISQVEVGGRKTFTAILRDITERKRAEQQLKELNATLEQRVTERTEEVTDANNRLRAIMDNALVGILALNERGLIETLNSAAGRIFGYSPKEMLGRNVGDFMASPHQGPGREFLGHYTQFADQRSMAVGRQVLGRRKDGQVMMIELTMSDFIHDGKREFVAMVRDITERKRLERELLEISERERQRIGRDLHDGLGQQLHGLSYLAALVEKNLQEDASPRAPEVGKLNNYLGEALELTRSLARGLQPVKPVPQGLMLALRELAERTRSMYRVDCRLECRAPVLIHRHTAANHLYRIAQEAVNNAMKHGKPTRIRLKLAATRQRLLLGVWDNGVGIRARKHPGRGMGLHVMQYRADAIRGSLIVQKHPHGGTEVACTVKRQALLPSDQEIK